MQFTDEGYRLVRCAIGDGAVPMAAMLDILAGQGRKLNAVLEPGALEARHVRFLRPEWWSFYAPKSAPALAACLAAARVNRLARRRRLSHALGARRRWRDRGLRIDDDPPQRQQHARDRPRRLRLETEGMTKELSGKIAFVTGSGRGLGRVMADRLAELGADVAIHDLSWAAPAKYGEAADLDAVAKVLARHGGKVTAVSGNIGDKAAVAKMKEDIEAKLAGSISW